MCSLSLSLSLSHTYGCKNINRQLLLHSHNLKKDALGLKFESIVHKFKIKNQRNFKQVVNLATTNERLIIYKKKCALMCQVNKIRASYCMVIG